MINQLIWFKLIKRFVILKAGKGFPSGIAMANKKKYEQKFKQDPVKSITEKTAITPATEYSYRLYAVNYGRPMA